MAANTRRVGIIAGAFNPVTRAHIALADAARAHVDEVVFTIPRTFPHKQFEGAGLEQRIEMLSRAANHRVAITEGGLYIDMAREVRQSCGEQCEMFVICGRDAADRMCTWEYESPDALTRMFEEFQLLVANRQGVYVPPAGLQSRVHSLELPLDFDDVSSSEVRRRIAAREPWEHLVPPSIVNLVWEVYEGRA